jgi:hypothetical protein
MGQPAAYLDLDDNNFDRNTPGISFLFSFLQLFSIPWNNNNKLIISILLLDSMPLSYGNTKKGLFARNSYLWYT